jgi:histone deacetylase 11
MVAEPWPSPRIVYDRRFNIGLLGLERLHPFDSRKYGRAWNQLRQQFGRDLDKIRLKPARPISGSELRAVHSVAYLRRLRSARFVAAIVEVPQLRFLPGWISDWAILRPMRWATMGTVVSCRAAMEHGLVINLAGGYHHANPEDGHGFSVYADVGIAVGMLRKEGKLAESDRIVYVDLDAHQGNGVCRTFFDDRSFFIYDQYNASIFPGDLYARRRIDCDVPLPIGCDDATYLGHLRAKLPP